MPRTSNCPKKIVLSGDLIQRLNLLRIGAAPALP